MLPSLRRREVRTCGLRRSPPLQGAGACTGLGASGECVGGTRDTRRDRLCCGGTPVAARQPGGDAIGATGWRRRCSCGPHGCRAASAPASSLVAHRTGGMELPVSAHRTCGTGGVDAGRGDAEPAARAPGRRGVGVHAGCRDEPGTAGRALAQRRSRRNPHRGSLASPHPQLGRCESGASRCLRLAQREQARCHISAAAAA